MAPNSRPLRRPSAATVSPSTVSPSTEPVRSALTLRPAQTRRTASASAAAWARGRGATPAAASRARSHAPARTHAGRLRGRPDAAGDAHPQAPRKYVARRHAGRALPHLLPARQHSRPRPLRRRRRGDARDAQGQGPHPLRPQGREAARYRRAGRRALDLGAPGLCQRPRQGRGRGGTLTLLKEPKLRKVRKPRSLPAADEADEPAGEAEPAVEADAGSRAARESEE